jgi:hypothetical protein
MNMQQLQQLLKWTGGENVLEGWRKCTIFNKEITLCFTDVFFAILDFMQNLNVSSWAEVLGRDLIHTDWRDLLICCRN